MLSSNSLSTRCRSSPTETSAEWKTEQRPSAVETSARLHAALQNDARPEIHRLPLESIHSTREKEVDLMASSPEPRTIHDHTSRPDRQVVAIHSPMLSSRVTPSPPIGPNPLLPRRDKTRLIGIWGRVGEAVEIRSARKTPCSAARFDRVSF